MATALAVITVITVIAIVWPMKAGPSSTPGRWDITALRACGPSGYPVEGSVPNPDRIHSAHAR